MLVKNPFNLFSDSHARVQVNMSFGLSSFEDPQLTLKTKYIILKQNGPE